MKNYQYLEITGINESYYSAEEACKINDDDLMTIGDLIIRLNRIAKYYGNDLPVLINVPNSWRNDYTAIDDSVDFVVKDFEEEEEEEEEEEQRVSRQAVWFNIRLHNVEIVHKENNNINMKKGSVISMLKIVGLKKVAGESKYLNKYKGEYLQLNYDIRSGKVWTDFFCSFNDFWEEYHDSNVINCGNISEKVTMHDVREIVENAVKRLA